MKELYVNNMAGRLQIKPWQVENCILLFEDGCTIPFISRYRKEQTGNLDDASVAELKHWMDFFTELEKRKNLVKETISQAGALSREIEEQIDNCTQSSILEDIYLPFKPKRRTRASIAREKGLEPLADLLCSKNCHNPQEAAKKFIKNGIEDSESALAGARDIIAERISENAPVRENLRNILRNQRIEARACRGAKDREEAEKYRDYFDFSRPLKSLPAHNVLALLRAQSEDILSLSISCDGQKCENKIYYDFCQQQGYPSRECAPQVQEAVADSLERLLLPSISNEVIKEAKQKADTESVAVFGENLRQLLLEAPVGQKRTLAIDPGFRNGCKLAVLSEQGELLEHAIIFPHPPQSDKIRALCTLQDLVDKYQIQTIALGNGTASRESREFLKRVELPRDCQIYLVSEDGASIYSASEVARQEMPDQDVTVRGAVSIGRRLMDPLAELVKIDPKNLGIGQYQHDVDQTLLKEKLDNTISICVNSVGVNLNTASPYLLAYVAGIGPALAQGIVEYRKKNGAFKCREELKKVPRLGPKAFEQCAGFLRIKGGSNPLDASAVHPESYPIALKMAKDLGIGIEELIGNEEKCKLIEAERYISKDKGLPTISDIIRELAKPGLDPRQEAGSFAFDESISDISQLREGMQLPGIVNNITNFGAFIDIGLHENGLLHASQLKGRRLKLHEKIQVRIISVDLDRKRISLGL